MNPHTNKHCYEESITYGARSSAPNPSHCLLDCSGFLLGCQPYLTPTQADSQSWKDACVHTATITKKKNKMSHPFWLPRFSRLFATRLSWLNWGISLNANQPGFHFHCCLFVLLANGGTTELENDDNCLMGIIRVLFLTATMTNYEFNSKVKLKFNSRFGRPLTAVWMFPIKEINQSNRQ